MKTQFIDSTPGEESTWRVRPVPDLAVYLTSTFEDDPNTCVRLAKDLRPFHRLKWSVAMQSPCLAGDDLLFAVDARRRRLYMVFDGYLLEFDIEGLAVRAAVRAMCLDFDALESRRVER